MDKTKRQGPLGSARYKITTAFMSVALAGQAIAAPQATASFNNAACAQDLSPDDLKKESGYSNADDLRMASAYAQYMEEQGKDPRVIHAILEASEETGVDFELMIVKAILESSLGEHDKPLHVDGGARGLYQFLPATWLTLFAWFGEDYEGGMYKDLAKAIKFDQNRNPYVTDPTLRQRILDLRSNYNVSAFIKAQQIKNDEHYTLRAMLGREPRITDYYIAHFLGIPRARTFFNHLKNNPNGNAAAVMTKEARYNRFVFYQGNRARSFSEVYQRLDRIIQDRLTEVREISQDTLDNNSCTPLLKRNAPPTIQPGARYTFPYFPNPD